MSNVWKCSTKSPRVLWSQVQSPLGYIFLLNIFCCSPSKPLLPTFPESSIFMENSTICSLSQSTIHTCGWYNYLTEEDHVKLNSVFTDYSLVDLVKQIINRCLWYVSYFLDKNNVTTKDYLHKNNKHNFIESVLLYFHYSARTWHRKSG